MGQRKMKRKAYEKELARLEIALVHLIGGRYATAQSGRPGDGDMDTVRVDVA